MCNRIECHFLLLSSFSISQASFYAHVFPSKTPIKKRYNSTLLLAIMKFHLHFTIKRSITTRNKHQLKNTIVNARGDVPIALLFFLIPKCLDPSYLQAPAPTHTRIYKFFKHISLLVRT